MRLAYVYYDLQDGFIDHWLVAGPQNIPAAPGELATLDDRNPFTAKYYSEDSGITKTPVERGPLTKGLFQIGDYEGSWSYMACGQDHFIDQSAYLSSPHLLRSWAYVQLFCKEPQKIILQLHTGGPFDVWLNRQHRLGSRDYPDESNTYKLTQAPIELGKGANILLLRWENAGVGPCAHTLNVRILPQGGSLYSVAIRTRIPSLIRSLKRRRKLEKAYQAAYLEREVFAQEDPIAVRWPNDPDSVVSMTVRLRSKAGGIYGQAEIAGEPGDVLTLGMPLLLPPGPAEIAMLPVLWEYYEVDLRITRQVPIWTMGNQRFTETPYGDFASRKREALHWAKRYAPPIYKATAQMMLHAWDDLDIPAILEAVKEIDPLKIDSALQLLGGLGMVARFQDQAPFPKQIIEAVMGVSGAYHYTALDPIYLDDEGSRLLRLTCELLAGQLFPELLFAADGQPGHFHQQHAEKEILVLFHNFAKYGLDSWNSGLVLERVMVALTHLVDLTQAESIWNLSGVLLDKFFFSLALNTFKGVYGAARSDALTGEVKNGMLAATAGITRLMWGLGIFNQHLAGVVSLACTENYELPLILADIACRYPEEMWDRELQGTSPVSTMIYRTPDTMLASVTDYHLGQPGQGEHLWQATLGSSAIVFVNYPACASQEDSRQPNAWRGNRILPRIAQRKDTLIGLYRLEEQDPLGFTHGYFPEYAFDEISYRTSAHNDQWAFARKGDGYLALMASTGLERVTSGPDAFRELRSYGKETIWLCILGRAALDGDFSQFQAKALGLSLQIKGLSISFLSLRGETLQFNWDDSFVVDGKEVSFTHSDHFNNPYCQTAYPCKNLVIRTPDYRLRLDFSDLDTLENLS